MPLHVVAGSLESDRLRRDSGVLGMNGMIQTNAFVCIIPPINQVGGVGHSFSRALAFKAHKLMVRTW